MKLISLNIWEAKVRQPLFDFLDRCSKEIDIFCFQEVFPDRVDGSGKLGNKGVEEELSIFRDLEKILPGHNGIIESPFSASFGFREGLAMFIKKEIGIESEGEVNICDPTKILKIRETLALGNLQYAFLSQTGKSYCISHVHGLWNGPDKDDGPDRLEQSRRIKEFLDAAPKPKIICGDFNLWPETESIKMLENGMRNLVKEFKITSTRSNYFKYPNKYADYIFVSPEVKVIDFRVIEDEVSDHFPLLLEFE